MSSRSKRLLGLLILTVLLLGVVGMAHGRVMDAGACCASPHQPPTPVYTAPRWTPTPTPVYTAPRHTPIAPPLHAEPRHTPTPVYTAPRGD